MWGRPRPAGVQLAIANLSGGDQALCLGNSALLCQRNAGEATAGRMSKMQRKARARRGGVGKTLVDDLLSVPYT